PYISRFLLILLLSWHFFLESEIFLRFSVSSPRRHWHRLKPAAGNCPLRGRTATPASFPPQTPPRDPASFSPDLPAGWKRSGRRPFPPAPVWLRFRRRRKHTYLRHRSPPDHVPESSAAHAANLPPHWRIR